LFRLEARGRNFATTIFVAAVIVMPSAREAFSYWGLVMWGLSPAIVVKASSQGRCSTDAPSIGIRLQIYRVLSILL
jgi:hypothetical protein